MSPELLNNEEPPQNIFDDAPSEIERFYHGRNILVTGGTGFMGKVLIEKLLHVTANIGSIYVPIRTKRGKEPQERLGKILQSQMFHRVRPHLWKIVPVPANMCETGLGLSREWRQRLCEDVSIVFHAAATTRFNAYFPYAIKLNTRGTREMLELAKHMPNIVAFVHVSTMYCNTDRKTIEEVLYPEHADWRTMIRIAEKADPDTLGALTHKLIGGRRALPNTYTFSKSLAEHVIKEYANTVPCVILRPSIVINSIEDPMPGWTDNFNGPSGLMVAGALGLVHSIYVDSSLIADFVPVDVAIKAMVVAAWKKATVQSQEKGDIAIYNASTATIKGKTVKEGLAMSDRFYRDIPLNNTIWISTQILTTNYFYYYIVFVLLQLIPAIIADIFLKLVGNKLRIETIHFIVSTFLKALVFYIILNSSWVVRLCNYLYGIILGVHN